MGRVKVESFDVDRTLVQSCGAMRVGVMKLAIEQEKARMGLLARSLLEWGW